MCGDSRDRVAAVAAADHKQPAGELSISERILQRSREGCGGGGGRIGGVDCCQTMTGDRDTGFLSLCFPCPALAPARSPSLPDRQTTIAAFLAEQPGRLPYRQVRHWDLRRQWASGPAGALPNSSSNWPGRSIVGGESESSQCDPVSPVSVVDQRDGSQLLLILQ